MEKNNIIFLDMDGVLRPWVKGEKGYYTVYSSDTIKNLNYILYTIQKKVGIKPFIVISSSWRYENDPKEMQSILSKLGISCTVIDDTPDISLDERGTEIKSWINSNKNKIKNYVIIDDMRSSVFSGLTDNFVETNPRIGLTRSDADKAIQILLNNLNESLYEAKQVGELRHYTSIISLRDILKTNKLKASSHESKISFTRDKNFHRFGYRKGIITHVALVIDGDKLSEKYKLKPYQHSFGDINKSYYSFDKIDELLRDEQEETVIKKEIPNIKSYIKKIIIIQKNSPDGYSDTIMKFSRTIKNAIKSEPYIVTDYERRLEKLDEKQLLKLYIYVIKKLAPGIPIEII